MGQHFGCLSSPLPLVVCGGGGSNSTSRSSSSGGDGVLSFLAVLSVPPPWTPLLFHLVLL